LNSSFYKSAFLPELQEHWKGLQPHHQQLATLGAALAAAGVAHRATRSSDDQSTDWLTPALTLGGAGVGAYGLSGGDFRNVPAIFSKLTGSATTGNLVAPPGENSTKTGTKPTSVVAQGLSSNPALSRFFNPDGSVRFHDVIRSSDEDLAAGAKTLGPAAREVLRNSVTSFKPNAMQAFGARMTGIDVEAQRRRLLGHLQ
jgi:hypothetical protein